MADTVRKIAPIAAKEVRLLMEYMGYSEKDIHRILDNLERQGKLKRVPHLRLVK